MKFQTQNILFQGYEISNIEKSTDNVNPDKLLMKCEWFISVIRSISYSVWLNLQLALLAKILESLLKECDSFFLHNQRVCKTIKNDYVFSSVTQPKCIFVLSR